MASWSKLVVLPPVYPPEHPQLMPTAKNPASAGARFRAALAAEKPLQVAGTINAYSALLAERAGFKAIYLSGAGVANASFGLPDLGITSLNDVCEDVRRITSATDVPLLVDADTGWGAAFNISRTISDLIKSGAGACHLEDQVQAKRCGHRPGKALVSADEMIDRIECPAVHALEITERALSEARLLKKFCVSI
jgi:methylisocitrate lyase